MMGITPDMFTFIGMCVDWPPYIFRPTTRLAYCTGRRRSALEMNTIKTTRASMPAMSSAGTLFHGWMKAQVMIPESIMAEPVTTGEPYSGNRLAGIMTVAAAKTAAERVSALPTGGQASAAAVATRVPSRTKSDVAPGKHGSTRRMASSVAAALVTRSLMLMDGPTQLHLDRLAIKPHIMRMIIQIGLPAGIQSCMFSLSNVVIQSSVNSFGSIVIAGNAAGANVGNFVYQAMNTFQQAVTCFAGQNSGRAKYSGYRGRIIV